MATALRPCAARYQGRRLAGGATWRPLPLRRAARRERRALRFGSCARSGARGGGRASRGGETTAPSVSAGEEVAPPRGSTRRRATAPIILLYHRIAAGSPDPLQLCVAPRHFRDHLAVLSADYAVVSMDEMASERRPGTVALT